MINLENIEYIDFDQGIQFGAIWMRIGKVFNVGIRI